MGLSLLGDPICYCCKLRFELVSLDKSIHSSLLFDYKLNLGQITLVHPKLSPQLHFNLLNYWNPRSTPLPPPTPNFNVITFNPPVIYFGVNLIPTECSFERRICLLSISKTNRWKEGKLIFQFKIQLGRGTLKQSYNFEGPVVRSNSSGDCVQSRWKIRVEKCNLPLNL